MCACVCARACMRVNYLELHLSTSFATGVSPWRRGIGSCFQSAKPTIHSNIMHSFAVKDLKFQHRTHCLVVSMYSVNY